MKLEQGNQFWQFTMLHIDLVKRVFLIDLLFLLCSVMYLLMKIPDQSELFRVGVLVMLIILLFTSLNIRFVTMYTGGLSFYRLLPMNGILVIVKSHGLMLLPFIVVLLSIASILLLVSELFTLKIADLYIKTCHIIAAFCTVKFIAIPTYLLLRKGVLQLGAFFLLLIPLLLVISIFNEFFWSRLPFSYLLNLLNYIVMLLWIELTVIQKCK